MQGLPLKTTQNRTIPRPYVHLYIVPRFREVNIGAFKIRVFFFYLVGFSYTIDITAGDKSIASKAIEAGTFILKGREYATINFVPRLLFSGSKFCNEPKNLRLGTHSLKSPSDNLQSGLFRPEKIRRKQPDLNPWILSFEASTLLHGHRGLQ